MSAYRYWQVDTGYGLVAFRADSSAQAGRQVWQELLANLAGLIRETTRHA